MDCNFKGISRACADNIQMMMNEINFAVKCVTKGTDNAVIQDGLTQCFLTMLRPS